MSSAFFMVFSVLLDASLAQREQAEREEGLHCFRVFGSRER